jgi:hypothetical protein
MYFRTTVYFVFTKGVASRHLFTIIYRIRYASLQNHFFGALGALEALSRIQKSFCLTACSAQTKCST